MTVRGRVRSTIRNSARGGQLAHQWFSPTGAAAASAGVGVAGYALVHLATSRFYNKLGVTPQDLGLTYPSALAQAFYGAVILIFLGVCVVGGLAAGISLSGHVRKIRVPLLVAAFAVFLVLDLEGVREALADASFGIQAASAVVRGLAIGVLAGGLWYWVAENAAAKRPQTAPSEPRSWKRFASKGAIGGAAALVLFSAAVGGWNAAGRDSDAVIRGEAVPSELGGVALYPWRASVAVVEWEVAVPEHVDQPTCGLYLGDSTSGAIIYTRRTDGSRAVFRIPGRAGTVAILPENKSCDWPADEQHR